MSPSVLERYTLDERGQGLVIRLEQRRNAAIFVGVALLLTAIA
ncbi:MAG: hypothetical protein ABI609_13540 [Acidobacteriota bacterium]